ncbi:hypothetical protein [Caenispirillum bisanense]|uniref:hypothetical protein n=1 Tax=Caenispirillum bisanense TaxID=414052 RepID=UPI0031D3D435
MSDTTPTASEHREVVGLFADRDSLEKTIRELRAAGFDRTDLSLLTSHESIDVRDPSGQSFRERLVLVLTEWRYEVPLVGAGLIALASGPTGAAIAALVGAGVGIAAVRDLVEEVTSLPDTDEFARELAAGAVALWVDVSAAEGLEQTARDILTRHGAGSVHLHVGPARTEP